MAESEEELKSLLMKVKEEREKTGLKLNIQKIEIMASGPVTSWQIEGEKWKQWQILFSWAPKSLQMVTAAIKLKDACSLEGKPTKVGINSQSYGFSSRHVWMWELDHKEAWVPKNWCLWTVTLEKIFESPLDSKEIKPVNLKGNQP